MAKFTLTTYIGFYLEDYTPDIEILKKLEMYNFNYKTPNKRGVFFGNELGQNDFQVDYYINGQELNHLKELPDFINKYLYQNIPKEHIKIISFISY